MAEGPNPKKKHLLHRLVKKVVHSRQTIEVWYGLPNSQRFADCTIWLPICNRLRTRPGRAEPEVWFRVVLLAQERPNGAPAAPFREQPVEISLGPKGAIENENVGPLGRRAAPGQVVRSIPPTKPASELKTPRVVELLRKAIEWQDLLESGENTSQADIANREGVTRARVTQVLGLLRLPPEIQEEIPTLPHSIHRRPVTERLLRPIAAIADQRDQLREFHRILL